MERIHFTYTTEYRLGERLVQSVQTFAAAELLLLSLLRILSSEFSQWGLKSGHFWNLQGIMAITVVLFGVVAPAFGKFRAPVSVGLELCAIAACGWFCWRNLKELWGGFARLSQCYVRAWNAYYGTNYAGWDDWRGQISYTLCFIVAVVMLLFLILRYLTGVRLFMLVPPLAGLSLGLLVNVLPDSKGLVYFVFGTLILYSGLGEQRRVVFQTAPQSGTEGAPLWLLQLGHTAVTAVLAGLVVLFADAGFGDLAAKIPEKTESFLEFQLSLEENIRNLSSIRFASDRAYVNNKMPDFSNQLIMEIQSQALPDSSLYLPEFSSGTYRRGKWTQDSASYRRAAAADGIDADRLGMLLRQTAYENLQQCESGIVSYRGVVLQDYTITYHINTSRALMPYFSDVAGAGNDVWVTDEGLAKKKRFVDTVSFSGWGRNVLYHDLYSQYDYCLRTEPKLSETSGENLDGQSAQDWYSSYVEQHYLNGTDVEAVKEFAQVVLAGYNNQWISAEGDSKWEYDYFTNMYRLDVALEVQKRLSAVASYNLYLDMIPSGTDTLAYFLETGHEGYCMHFASVGTLALQEMGIPARYASGYVVKRNAFERKVTDEYCTAQVYDRNAHAWTEIYLEGIGWVPFEMTPGYTLDNSTLPTDEQNQEKLQEQHASRQEQSAQSNSQKESEAAEQQSSETQETQESQSKENDTQQSSESQGTTGTAGKGGVSSGGGVQGGGWSGILKVAAVVAAATAVILLIAAAFVFVLRRYRELLWQELRHRQYRRAVRRINRRIYRRLQKGGLRSLGDIRLRRQPDGKAAVPWSGITDAEYAQRLVKAYPSITLEDWNHYMEIVQKAAFSREKISREEAGFCYHIYCKHRESARHSK